MSASSVTTAETDNDPDLLARAAAIHARVLTVDTHVDIPPDFGTESYDPREAKGGRGQIDLVGMERGGLDAVFFIVYVGQGERNVAGYARAMADAFTKFAAIRRMTDVQYPETISLARTAADVRRIHGQPVGDCRTPAREALEQPERPMACSSGARGTPRRPDP